MTVVYFFAQTRELVGLEKVTLESSFNTIEDIRLHLLTVGNELNEQGKWELALDPSRILASLNHSIVPLTSVVKNNDEIAFFPPVTGG